MSESIKSDLGAHCTHEDISTSSSNNTYNNPVLYTGVDENEKELGSRRGSNSSFQRSLDIVRKTLTGASAHSVNSQYSVTEIFRDLDDVEIEHRREKTKNDILEELIQKTNDLQEGNEHNNDLPTFYENLPDSGIPVEKDGEEFQKIDPELIAWEGFDDPEDPKNWRLSKKIIMMGFVSLYALVSPMSSSMLSPAVSKISIDFGITNPTVSSLMVSIQILAWAVGPLVIAPLSEYDFIGRKPVLDISIWLSFFFNLACGLSQNTAQMLVFRFVGGLFGSSPLNVGAGVISDLFEPQSRNLALAGFALAPLLGPVIAPVIAGFIVEHKSWRWTFYVLSIFNGAVALAGTLLFRETYSPTLLKSKAQKLRKESGNENLHTIYEIADGETFFGKMSLTMTRPVILLFTHPMIFGLGSFLAFVYGFMYLMIVTFPKVYSQKYGYGTGITGLMYLPMGVGFLMGVLVWTPVIDKVYNKLIAKNHGEVKPEFKLPCMLVVGIIIPVGLVWYGWSVEKKLHWIMPGIGSGIFAFGVVCAFQACQGYIIDMNPRFAASSVAAAALFRSLFGFSFPLFADKMYERLNYGWGNTMSAFIAFALGIPFPLYCYLNGEKIRTKYNRKMELQQLKRDQKNLERLQNKK